MQHKRLVIDANILIRAVLGARVRHLIEYYCESVAFYMAEANAKEAEFYLSTELAEKRNLSEEIWRPVFNGILNTVQIITDDVLIEVESKAKARIASRDINDWPAVAAALLLDCPVWTEDKDFLGAGVAIWTTATVEIYLSNA
ncbi:PIN domain-containing protein [Methylotuvimicrobium sp. KM2]|uniref:PIN domain-containing protein n=1 Tax=Methylotuvimicrobium sp. KM2 TaxID=3133976 RepID=UPI0031012B3D